jgi:hypothetical protein
MNSEELKEYEGKSVLASYRYDNSKGVVFRGKFYRIDIDRDEIRSNNLIIQLLEYSPEDLLGVLLFDDRDLSLLERGILHSLEFNLPALEAFIPFSIRRVK